MALENKAPVKEEPVIEESVEEEVALPDKLAVKNISKASLYLTYGEVKPGESGECSKSEYENLAGAYLEKV
jgi:hypothetical protein